ncbi:MAG: formylglycine-generating enzyme family protein [Planctomycetaceae bacterium]
MKNTITALLMVCFALSSVRGQLAAQQLSRSIVGMKSGEIRSENSAGIRMVWIAADRFTMGSPQDEKGNDANEGQVEVSLTESFWLGQTEITQGQWTQLMGTSPWHGKANVREGKDYPASFISWEDASSFVKKLNLNEHDSDSLPNDWNYSLPTEAQWEYACRGGKKTAFSFGDDPVEFDAYGWSAENAFEKGEPFSHEVGRKRPNEYGLHDMHGNVWEWCKDNFDARLPGGTDPLRDDGSPLRVNRGGGWNFATRWCRSASRLGDAADSRYNNLGFRIALVRSSR